VFASHRVDFGTQLLLETVIEQIRSQSTKSGRLLDLGCGYGVVGVVMKRFFRQWMS
jgi:16S rRNA (guanine1207-N2)-methyltransferase